MSFRVAEFFAGMGLVRLGLGADYKVVFANDIDPVKCKLYAARFGTDELQCGDLRDVPADEIPTVDLATASFPCTDLSLAGNRAGLNGSSSSIYWTFVEKLKRMGNRRPRVLLIENVSGFGSSGRGQDISVSIRGLNELGYSCDVLLVDARHFLPQSRRRVFVVAALGEITTHRPEAPSEIRPKWTLALPESDPGLVMHSVPIPIPGSRDMKLSNVIEQMESGDERWWTGARLSRFMSELAPRHQSRLEELRGASQFEWATAFRRTRNGSVAWEVRGDRIAGCLRTTRGGSSKQAVVEGGNGELRVRWMTPLEYARLQGADTFPLAAVTANQAMSALGDAVCVPVIRYLTEHYISPLLAGLIGFKKSTSRTDPPELNQSTDVQEPVAIG